MFQKNELVRSTLDACTYRVLIPGEDKCLMINCDHQAMPEWVYYEELFEYHSGACLVSSSSLDELSPIRKKKAIERYTMISAALSVMGNKRLRTMMINQAAEQYNVSKQTLRIYLWQYLVYQDISVLAPKELQEKPLTDDQKNFRWALNKFFYNRNKNSLATAYTQMLKEKYCDTNGELKPHPTFAQFKYFYLKTRKMENYYISRDGIKDYQRNKRPLLGDGGVQEYAPTLGTAMLDGTVCDIYLVDDSGQLVGRPVMVAAVDANTSLCLGYSLLWEGGTYSLHNLALNMVADKVELCNKMGIQINPSQWPNTELPTIMVTDGGAEYKSKDFEQIAELGVTLINLPGFRPELKGPVEKFFDLLQSSFKTVLKGKGVILSDFQERGGHDYRKDAVLTLADFEKIIVRCIVYYNSERIIENYPYTAEMVQAGVKPHASDIWNYKLNEIGNNLINVTSKDLMLTLLPRTKGRFDRKGLHVNKLRYMADGYKERYLTGGDAVVAYNPDNTNTVWLKESDGSFVEFRLIESRYANKTIDEIEAMRAIQREVSRNKETIHDNQQAMIDTMDFIATVAQKDKQTDVNIKGIRKTRQTERKRTHKDLGEVIK